jgi:succinyl-CoA synthetase alpha subunit
MSILVNKDTRVVCQGITGKHGGFHAGQCLDYGTRIVAGCTPGKGGQTFEHGKFKVPVFDTVYEAAEETAAEVAMIFVPAKFAADAAMEAADAGLRLIVLITEGIPTLDMIRVRKYLDDQGAMMIGPNCPGIITPGECKIGIMPGYIHKPACSPAAPGRSGAGQSTTANPAGGGRATGKNVGVISRSGTLTYEVVWQCSERGIGQTTCVGIGGDPVKGLNFIELLDMFEADPATDAMVMIGEIGGTDEEQAAAHIKRSIRKPVVAFIAGQTAPPGKRMGHAGAIISGGEGTAQSKIAALREAGIAVSDSPATIGDAVKKVLG